MGRTADDRHQLQLPVGLLGPRGQHDVVVRAGDRARQADEDVRQVVGCPTVHDLCGFGTPLLLGAVVGRVPVRDMQVDDVLAVVGAGLEHLARLDRGVHPEVRQRPALRTAVIGQRRESRRSRVPGLQEAADGQVRITEGSSQVEYLGVRRDERGEGRSVRCRERGEGEGSGEELGRGCRFHEHVLLIAV